MVETILIAVLCVCLFCFIFIGVPRIFRDGFKHGFKRGVRDYNKDKMWEDVYNKDIRGK